MKVVILAGGFGTRLGEETSLIPKPMVEIGGRPILWHIMKMYSHYGHHDFVLLLGYRGYLVKEYFSNYFLHQSDVTIDLTNNAVEIHKTTSEPWKVTLLDTGLNSMTGGRIKRAKHVIGNDPFMLTYGDGVSDINLDALLKAHKNHGKTVTMTVVQPEGRFGATVIEDDDRISSFLEKPKGDGAWINGGFFVCEAKVLDYIGDDATVFEQEPLQRLAAEGELYAHQHKGFWKCMDTLRDKMALEGMVKSGKAKWKTWE